MLCTFVVPGEPRGKARQRQRHVKTKDGREFQMNYATADTVNYESHVRYAARAAMNGTDPHRDIPVTMAVSAFFGIPRSWSKLKQMRARNGLLWPTKKPDYDNVLKAVSDACTGVVFADDALITSAVFTKAYAESPRVEVVFSRQT